jgi:adenosylcobinamide-GDP ribazoletransferase
MDTLILALQLLTGLPIRKSVDVTDDRLIRGVAFWPLVGVIIGLFDGLIFFLAGRILPLSIAAAFAIVAELWITRGFHLDGLCDTADALFSSRNRERMLEIMKDSHIGTFGVVAAVGDLAFKYLLITASGMPFFMLLAAPVAGKMVQGLCMYRAHYPRENGLGKSYIGRIPKSVAVGGAVFGFFWLSLCILVGSFQTGQAVMSSIDMLRIAMVPLLCFVMAWLFRRHMDKTIGGMTGDTLGAASELTEIFCMLFIVVLEGVR